MLGGIAVLSFAVAVATAWVLVSRYGRFALDRPNERSMHSRPVPRTGGIAVLAGAACSAAFELSSLWLPIVLVVVLAAVSLLDDVFEIPIAVRLGAHFASAGVLVWYTLSPMGLASMVLLVLAVAWMTNLYNFMDGSDGIAGGMGLIGFGAYAVAAHAGGSAPLAALCLALSAGAAGFLVLNFHPAKIFLGDVGSIPLGFLSAALGLVGWRNDLWPLWFPLLVFGPFVGDATVTLLKRLVQGDRVWRAHREHYYQRMVRMGIGQRGTAALIYVLMLACAAAALYGRNEPGPVQAAAFAGATVVLAAVAVWVDVRWARFLRAPSKPA